MNHYQFEELLPGVSESFSVEITQKMMEQFLSITNDENPLHTDEAFARARGYEGRVVYGMLTGSFLSTLAGMYLPGEKSLIHRVEMEFPRPVYIGDCLTITGTVSEKNDVLRYIVIKVVIKNQKEEKVCRGKMRIGLINEE